MAKLTGLREAYGAGVQSLGRESVSGPVRVATAQANVAQKKAQVATQIAGNVAAIGNIRQGMGRELVASQQRQIGRDQQFAADMRRLVGQGADLTATMIKSNAARGLRDYEIGEETDMMGIQNTPVSVDQPLDPNKPSLGNRAVSTHNSIMPHFQKQQLERKEAILANTTPLARPLVEQLINERQAQSTLEMKDFVIGRAKDFEVAQGDVLISEQMDRHDYGAARKLLKEFSFVYTAKKTAGHKIIIDRAEAEYELEGRIFDAYQGIAGKSATERNAMISKVRDKDQREGLQAMSDRQDRVTKENKRLAKERKQENFDQTYMAQVRAAENGEMLAADIRIPETDDPSVYKAAMTHRKNMAEGKLVITQPVVEQKAYDMAAIAPDKFMKSDLNLLMNSVNDSDLDKLKTLQRNMRGDANSQAEATKEIKFAQGISTMINSSLSSIGVTKKNAAKHAALTRLATKQVQAYETEKGKAASPAEKQEIIDRTVRDGFSVSRETFLGVGYESTTEYDIEDVSPELINPIADVLRSRGEAIHSQSLTKAAEEYNNSIEFIDRALVEEGMPITLENRMRMFGSQ